ncbi:hypothetical protein A20_1330 [Streptococcus pyogenes A20]|nr:hypothetical protein A20_1330 [Streptococcus pyogenes A20]
MLGFLFLKLSLPLYHKAGLLCHVINNWYPHFDDKQLRKYF